jgi:hypothetical protein
MLSTVHNLENNPARRRPRLHLLHHHRSCLKGTVVPSIISLLGNSWFLLTAHKGGVDVPIGLEIGARITPERMSRLAS